MKTYLGVAAGVTYTMGFLVVQVHLLRFGILEISPLQAYYLLVGLWFFLCMAPALIVILAAEYLLSSLDPRKVQLIVLLAGCVIAASVIAGIVRFSALKLIFNFNAYPYPYWYAYWNLAGMNLSLIFAWLICFAYFRLTGLKQAAWKLAVMVGGLVIANSAVFFGRTIYPALDRGVGGGAPQFAEVVETNGKSHFVLQVYAGEDYLYLLELSALPAKFNRRSAGTQFATDSSGPVYRALVDNQVLKLSNAQVFSVRTFGHSQGESIGSYLGK